MAGSALYRYSRKRGKLVHKGGPKLATLRSVKRLISNRQEKKIHTVDVSGVITTTVAFNQVSAVPQGDTDLSRDGDELIIKSLHWNWAFVGADATNRMRIMVIQWHGDGASNPPVASDIFQVDTTTGHFGQLRKDTSSLFSVLYDRFLTTDTYAMIKHSQVNMYKKFRKKISYISGSTNGMGQLYTVAVSDSSGIAHPSIDSQFCLRFTDS